MVQKIIKKDKNGNIIYTKGLYGLERWYEYNKFESLIHFKDSDGHEAWYEFDSNNKILRVFYILL